ncbi:methyltransferase domain-containing protein [Candidatus Wolfebacteria bacterium]|nr:methyltransferase domain-containing protein [Candidatus Wolfebacteria bacterium]
MLLFLWESVKNFNTFGTFLPSSFFAARELTSRVNFDTARVIVEFGGGSGSITKEILKRMRSDARLVSFESNTSLADVLREIPDDRLIVVHGMAQDFLVELTRRKIERIDSIVSTLPLSLFSPEERKKILEDIHDVLEPGSVYAQMQYSFILREEVKRVFPKMRISFNPLNVPPAFFYICER